MFPEALGEFKKALEIKPDWSMPYRMIAMAYHSQANKADAIKTLQDGIVATKASLDIVNDLAGFYHSNKEHDKAIAIYEEGYKHHPESLEALNNLVSYLTDFGDAAGLESAAKLAESLAKANSSNIMDTLGWLAYKQGNYAKAQEMLLKVIALDPNSAISNYHLGMIHFKQDNKALARELLQTAIDKKIDFIGLDTAKETLKSITNAS